MKRKKRETRPGLEVKLVRLGVYYYVNRVESDDSLRKGELVDGVQKTAGVGCREGQQRGTIRSCKGPLGKK